MKNKVAVLIKYIAFSIYGFGFIGGLLIALVSWGSLPALTNSFFSFLVFISTLLFTWIVTFISGSLFLALSEIINLLNIITLNTSNTDASFNISK